jgi:uncharacterized protein
MSQELLPSARYWIDKLKLKPHPEGGHYREIYRSGEVVRADHLPDRFNGARTFSTAIYFLLKQGEQSRLHRIKSDEVWHFYRGLPLTVHMFGSNGSYKAVRLGENPERGEHYQYMVPAGTWFGVTVAGNGDESTGHMHDDFALAGCTVAPGFDFRDFEIAADKIVTAYPGYQDILRKLL